MADYHQIVDQIRAFLQASDQTRSERLEGLASAFAGACAEVNQRLMRCQRLVQQGLRSEAIQLAEAQPRLLDAMVTLEFPERDQWDELAGIYDMPAAPRLSAEAGVALNEAYGKEHPLQDLLRHHRRLATQRAALRTRIAVMRKLVTQDPNNPIWAGDLRPFEKARLRQIQIEAAEAARSQDAAHLTRLLAEVQQGTWLDPPPKNLVNSLGKVEAQLRGQQARAALAELEVRLNEAFTARDAVVGQAARREWGGLVVAGPPEPDDPIWERVGPALRWLEDEDRAADAAEAHELALAALARALDEPDVYDPAELERLGQEVLKHGRGMPEALKRRYAAQLRVTMAARSRRSRILKSAAAAAIVVVTAAGGLFIQSSVRSGDAARAASDVARMLDDGDLDRAAAFVADLEKQDPALFGHDSLKGIRQRLQTALDEEKDRSERFHDAMKEARRAPVTATESKALAAARGLAHNESEKREVEQFVAQRQDRLKDDLEKREAQLRPLLDGIGREAERVEKLMQTPPIDPLGIDSALGAARRSLEERAPDIGQVGEELQGLARDLRQRLDHAADRMDVFRRQERLRREITDAVAYSGAGQANSLAEFADRLRAFATAFPEEPRSRAFQRALTEQPHWEAAVAWNRLVGAWTTHGDDLSPAAARERADACGQFRAQHPGFPGNTGLAAYQDYSRAIARRGDGQGGPTATLRKVLMNQLVDRVWMVKVRDPGNSVVPERLLMYYTPDRPVINGDYLQFQSFANLDRKTKNQLIRRDRIVSQDPSPQWTIARTFAPLLGDASKLMHWDDVMNDLMGAILRAPDIDPILQVTLLTEIVPKAGEGSEPFRIAWEPVWKKLDSSRINLTVAWVNPEASQLTRLQAEAADFIESVRAAVPGRQKVQAERDRIERVVTRTYRTVGWLAQDRDSFQIERGRLVPPDGDLLVIASSSADRADWLKVGAIAESKPALDPRDRSAMVEGRPVFVMLNRASSTPHE